MQRVLLVAAALVLTDCTPHSRAEPTGTRGTFVAVYRWRIRPDCEDRFRAAWQAETLVFRDTWGSYGTRLSRDDDGTWVALAFWPTRAQWIAAHRQPLPLSGPEATLAECIVVKEQELHLEASDDLTRFPSG
jgi:hypothetical protein